MNDRGDDSYGKGVDMGVDQGRGLVTPEEIGGYNLSWRRSSS